MAAFLLFYSNPTRAAEAGHPLAGTVVELATVDDIDALAARLGGQRLIIRPAGADSAPAWAEYHYLHDADDRAGYHAADTLPEGWQTMRWIEAYNGLRE